MRIQTLLTRLVVTLFAATAVFPAPVSADDAAALLAKHRAFVGWQFGDGTFIRLRETGEITHIVDGKPKASSTFTVIRANAVYRRTAIDTETGFATDTGYTGNVFWQTDQNGFIGLVIGDAMKATIAQQLVVTEATTGFDGTFQGNATVNGAPVSIVRISPASALPIDLYIDPSTGAYKRYIIDPDGAYRSTVDILSYIDGPGGKKFIGSSKFPESEYTGTVKTIEIPASVGPQDFAPPRPTASWSFDPSHAPIPIDYNWYRNHRIYFHARVNGVDGKFILDTGAGIGIALTQSFADQLHLKQLNTTTAHGVGGAVATKTAKIDTLELGGSTLHNVVVSYQDIKLDADGLMGYDLLAAAIAHVDLDAQTLTLYDPATTDFSELVTAGIPLTIGMNGGIPMVPMAVDGRIPVRAELDTGNPMYVLFGPDLVYKDHLTMMRHGALMGGVGGYEFVECGAISDISMGPVKYASAPACLSKSFDGHTVLVGLDFLRHFNFWLDYPNSQLVLVPRTSSSP
jgi:predicted aspartyl protease